MSIPVREAADDRALTADLERRVRELEERCGVISSHSVAVPPVVELYLDAMRTPGFDDLTARHWARQFLALTATSVLGLIREVQDPWAWRPFLRIADLYTAAGMDFEVPRRHILDVARQILNIQGLRVLSPRDVMGHPLPNLDRLHPVQPIRS